MIYSDMPHLGYGALLYYFFNFFKQSYCLEETGFIFTHNVSIKMTCLFCFGIATQNVMRIWPNVICRQRSNYARRF